MKKIEEPARKIPVIAEPDILVLGGGPAGLSAAIAAAREGTDTMLVERYGFCGGVITQSMIGTIAWYRYANTIDAGGIELEFEKRAKKMDSTFNVLSDIKNKDMIKTLEDEGLLVNGKPTYEILDTEKFKYVVDEMIQEAGVTPLLHSTAVDVVMDGNTIKGVIIENKSGRQAILAKRIIDATGDADIAYRAGVPCQKNPKDELMEVTVNFGCSGIKIGKFLMYIYLNPGKIGDWGEAVDDNSFSTYLVEPFNKAKEAGEIPKDARIESYWGNYTDAGEITSFNAVHMWNIDCTDVWDLTKAEIEGRRRVMMAVDALKKYTPGFKKARLRTIGTSLGTRESRKIVGSYNLTEDDVRNQARFKDSIGICPEFIDGYGVAILPLTGRYFHVPYGIILPKKVENLLVAGRCVAGDKVSHAATRQMVCCTVTGQGAGVAAAQSIKDGVTCKKVDITKVQDALKKQGVRIE
ncbi:MAG: FAD-dependent oxidoreductase [Candidatus Lokiarchaeota archaeon]|nr:FAD-dependent oxidoreductase [Candidatus Lokiarchaeota archaeon]MBD3338292.1 FAD-dependent oxidoreductase [Candidatus Lokiarchaeota archaeon]